MSNDRDILIRYLDGSLTDEELRTFERRLSAEKSLREKLMRLRAIGETVSSGRADGFGAFFIDRTMKALRPASLGQSTSLYDSLRWVFLRTAVASIAIVVILSVLNVMDYDSLDITSTWIEAAFGLPSITVEDAFSYGFI